MIGFTNGIKEKGEIMIYIGDDPGKTGAIVALDDEGDVIGVCRKSKTTIQDRCEFLNGLDPDNSNDFYAVIEKVGATPQMGTTSAFTFGLEFGFCTTIYVSLSIRHEFFTPQKWQQSLGLTSVKKSEGDTAKKRYLKENAQRIFPHEKIVNDTADAYLIAWFARRSFMGANTTNQKENA